MSLQQNFIELTPKYFHFLESEYGFRCVQVSEHIVRYESDSVYVNIEYDRQFGQIWCSLGSADQSDIDVKEPCPQAFDTGRIARWRSGEFHFDYDAAELAKRKTANSKEKLSQLLSEAAECLQRDCKELLLGSQVAFKELLAFFKEECAAYTRKVSRRRKK